MTSKQSAATKVLAPNDARILQLAHETLDIEAEALLQIKQRLSPTFVEAVHMLLKTTGHVVVMAWVKVGTLVARSLPRWPLRARQRCLSIPAKQAMAI